MAYFLELCKKSNKAIDENLFYEYEKLDNGTNESNQILRKQKTKINANEQSVLSKGRAMSQSNVN